MTTTHALLDDLEREWARLGVPVGDVLSPGLDPGEVERVVTSATGQVTADVITWFTWHNGSPSNWFAAPLQQTLLGLSLALEVRQEMLAVSASVPEGAAYRPQWLPIGDMGVGVRMVIDTKSGELYRLDWQALETFETPLAADLAAAVTVWKDVLAAGYYRWDGSDWQYDYLALPVDLKVRGLIG